MRTSKKLLVMAVVILAVIAMSLSVNATYVQTLSDYVGGIHNINGMVFELSDSQKTQALNYIATLDEATAESVYNQIIAIENEVSATGATTIAAIPESTRLDIIAKAKTAAATAGLTLTVDTSANTFVLTKADGTVVTSGYYMTNTIYTSSTGSSSGSSSTTTTLLYTGANYASYAVVALAIVAVAFVVKKRA